MPSKKDLMALPSPVRRFFGYALNFAQEGEQHDAAKVLKGLPDAEQLRIKSGLVIEITRAVRRLGLTQEEAGRQRGISQAKVSGLMHGDVANL